MWAQKRILVMEFISGRRPDDLDFLDRNGIDRDEVSATLAHIFTEIAKELCLPPVKCMFSLSHFSILNRS